jgi:hypothetical protein
MQDPNQLHSVPRSSAGYRPLVPVDLARGLGNSALFSVAAAAGFGLLIGVGFAYSAHHSKAAAPPKVSEALATRTSETGPVPAVYAATTPSLLNQVEDPKKTAAPPARSSPASKQSTGKAAQGHKHSGVHKLWNWAKGAGNHRPKRKPYVSPNPPAPADAPTALELANAAAAQGPSYVGIEGDATVASYDESAGSVGTYEGNHFVLDKSVAASGEIAWDDYPFHVHYRCDGSGTCTLAHHGASATARMTH